MIWFFISVVLALLVFSSGFRRFSAWLAGAACLVAILACLVAYVNEQRAETLRAKEAAEYRINADRQAQADAVAAAETLKAQQAADAARAAQEAREAPEKARRARAASNRRFAVKICEPELKYGPAEMRGCIEVIAAIYQKMDATPGLSAVDWASLQTKCFVFHHYQYTNVDALIPREISSCVDNELKRLRK